MPRELSEGRQLTGWLLAAATATALASGDPDNGALLAQAAGCAACHTAEGEAPFAGGHVVQTRWGDFVGSNLTPDEATGLGSWSFDDFERAMRRGRSPRGRHYYPSFPYPSFSAMTDQDLRDLWAYLGALDPVERPEEQHEIRFPYGMRSALGVWKLLFHRVRPAEPDRGAYLAEAVLHCGDCHTPRGSLGQPRRGRELSGSTEPPAGGPNITPHTDGIGAWDSGELMEYLTTGETPDGDFAGGEMGRVIRTGTARLSEGDRRALVDWVLSRPPRASQRSKDSSETDAPVEVSSEPGEEEWL